VWQPAPPPAPDAHGMCVDWLRLCSTAAHDASIIHMEWPASNFSAVDSAPRWMAAPIHHPQFWGLAIVPWAQARHERHSLVRWACSPPNLSRQRRCNCRSESWDPDHWKRL